MKKKALITGILGQDGPYLAKFLLSKGYKVYGMMSRRANQSYENLAYLGILDKVELVEGDMVDEASLMKLIKTIQPEEVYNLAAQSFVGASWNLAKLTTQVNAIGPLHLLNAIVHYSPTSKFYQASTSEMFGASSSRGFQDEDTPFHPRSPYAVSKVYGFWITVNYRESYGMFACNGILFNHESPIRGAQFVTRKITDGVVRIKLGLASKLRLGVLDARRDWGFAGDYVEAMYLMMQQKKPDDFVIGTGKSHSVADFVKQAFSCVGIKNWKKYIIIDPRFKRPVDVADLKARPVKAKRILKWKPKILFEELVKMMVDADINRLKTQS